MQSRLYLSLLVQICQVTFLTVIEDVCSQNLALGKLAKSSSAIGHISNPIPSKMVDGDPNPDLLKEHCFHGNDNPGGPNWAYVDLAGEYCVDFVNVFSRDVSSERLYHFLIGLTDASPGSNVVRGSYHLCGQHKENIIDGGRNSLKCNANLVSSYRYVIIQQPIDGAGYLTVCEFEVYGAKNLNSKKWKRYMGFKLTGYTSRVTTISCVMKCVFMCVPGLCHSINFQPDNSTCELNSHSFGYNLANLNVNTSWSFYEVSFA